MRKNEQMASDYDDDDTFGINGFQRSKVIELSVSEQIINSKTMKLIVLPNGFAKICAA
jgi:hypothetical protein